MANHKSDILIIGGGIAGCIAAISLVDNYHVIMIDTLSEPQDRIGESLAPTAQRILRQLDLLKGMEDVIHNNEPMYFKNKGMQSHWGSEQIHIIDHLSNPDGSVLNLNRKAFETYLRTVAIQRGVQCIWPAKLASQAYENPHWHIVAKDHKHKTYNLTARFVIDATGRQSHFARKQGVKRHHIDQLIACWATISDHQQNKMSRISASENGWWYSAVLPNNKRVLAFHTDSDLMDRKAMQDADCFLALAQSNPVMKSVLEKALGDIELHGIVAANSTCSQQVAGQQWAVLGDAAISFDPLSSQGMFNAMASAIQLKELINKFDVVNHPNTKNRHQFETDYTKQINQIWLHYLTHKDHYYRQEKRWKESVFWKRRH
ncbi:MAG: tryptophan 7-halogenase [Alcanivoracaceae bacterium]|nr:tryptophan 7-halogenase [Alcanivoracaceae bacterium]